MPDQTLTITKVTEKNGWYAAEANNGNKYSTKNAGIQAFAGKTATFITGSKPRSDGKGMNYYVNDPLPAVPAASSQTSAGSSPEDKNKYFILSYAKDLTVAAIMSAQLNAQDTDAIAQHTLALFGKLSIGMSEEPPV